MSIIIYEFSKLILGGGIISDLLKRVYKLMERENIKPTQLAKTLNMSTSTFTDWGKGKGSPSLKAVMQFAKYFDVSIDYLVYGKEYTSIRKLDFSNPEDEDLLDKFHQLPSDLRQKAIGYIEGMISAMPRQSSKEHQQKLSG